MRSGRDAAVCGMTMNSTAAIGIPTTRWGIRRPQEVRVRSDRLPIHGWMKMPSRLSMPMSSTGV